MLSICCSSCIKLSKNGKYPENISKIKPFINKYNWERIIYPSEKDDWKKLKRNKLTIDLDVFTLHTRKYILPTLKTKTQSMKNKLFFE